MTAGIDARVSAPAFVGFRPDSERKDGATWIQEHALAAA